GSALLQRARPELARDRTPCEGARESTDTSSRTLRGGGLDLTPQHSPLVVVLAGPDGAGKSTTAPFLLAGGLAVEEFVNADTIAQGISAYHPEDAALAAGRVMLERLRTLASEGKDFAFETTLAGKGHARTVAELQAQGYRAHLLFLSLSSPEL